MLSIDTLVAALGVLSVASTVKLGPAVEEPRSTRVPTARVDPHGETAASWVPTGVTARAPRSAKRVWLVVGLVTALFGILGALATTGAFRVGTAGVSRSGSSSSPESDGVMQGITPATSRRTPNRRPAAIAASTLSNVVPLPSVGSAPSAHGPVESDATPSVDASLAASPDR